MNNFTLIFIHGYTSSHLADWYPTISKELEKLDVDYIIPDLPGGKHPHAKDWLDTLYPIISQSTKPVVLIGHSLGTRTALLYLEKYRQKVEKVFLIAAFANRIENGLRRGGETYPDFFTHKINIEEIKSCVEKFLVMHSKDDSSIPYEQGQEIAKDLNATLLTYENRDHFSNEVNMPVILEVLRKELNF